MKFNRRPSAKELRGEVFTDLIDTQEDISPVKPLPSVGGGGNTSIGFVQSHQDMAKLEKALRVKDAAKIFESLNQVVCDYSTSDCAF